MRPLNSGMFSARWNALRLGSASSDPGPEHGLPRHGIGQPWSNGDGETIHPLDKLEKKDGCVTNTSPADLLAGNTSNKSGQWIF